MGQNKFEIQDKCMKNRQYYNNFARKCRIYCKNIEFSPKYAYAYVKYAYESTKACTASDSTYYATYCLF